MSSANIQTQILISNLYPGHLEVIESTIVKFLYNLIKDINNCDIDIELFDYSTITDESRSPEEFKNYIKNKYKNVQFRKRDITYDYIIDNTIVGSKSPTTILKSSFITNKENVIKGNYPKNKKIIVSDSNKHYYISHRIEESFFKGLKNIFYLTPLCKNDNYFIPSILPEINKINPTKLICAVQGNIKESNRNFKSLIPLLETYTNFSIKLIGRGGLPDCLQKYKDRIIMCNNLQWNDYHKAFEDVYCILPLIDDTFEHNYFTITFTSSISYAEAYKLICFYHEKLHNIYKLENSVVYNSNNLIDKFGSIYKRFYNKIKNITALGSCRLQMSDNENNIDFSIRNNISYLYYTKEILEVINFCKFGHLKPDETLYTFRSGMLNTEPVLFTKDLDDKINNTDIFLVEITSAKTYKYKGNYVHHILYTYPEYNANIKNDIIYRKQNDEEIENDIIKIKELLNKPIIIVSHIITDDKSDRYKLGKLLENICIKHNITFINPVKEISALGYNINDLVKPNEQCVHYNELGKQIIEKVYKRFINKL